MPLNIIFSTKAFNFPIKDLMLSRLNICRSNFMAQSKKRFPYEKMRKKREKCVREKLLKDALPISFFLESEILRSLPTKGSLHMLSDVPGISNGSHLLKA